MWQLLIAFYNPFFRLTVASFKIQIEVRQSASNAASRNGWILWYMERQVRYRATYLYCFYIYHSLIFSKEWSVNHHSDYYPDHFMLHNSATQKQSSTLQHVKRNNSLKNLNRVFDHSKWMTFHLNCLLGNYKLNCLNSLRPDPQEKSWQKRSEAKHNCFGGFCEYKYSMVDWSIITELQIQNILRKC